MTDPRNDRIDYVEIATRDVAASKRFFADLAGWEFVDHGEEYASFHDGRLDGGFGIGDPAGGTLPILFMENLNTSRARVLELGATITKDIFSFPGGHRFECTDPGGAHFAIWSDMHQPG